MLGVLVSIIVVQVLREYVYWVLGPLGLNVLGSGFSAQGSVCGVSVLWLRLQCFGFRVQGLGSRV